MLVRLLLCLFGLSLMLACFAAAWWVWTRDPVWPFAAAPADAEAPPAPSRAPAPVAADSHAAPAPAPDPAPANEHATEIIDRMGGALLLAEAQASAPADADHTMILSDMRGPVLAEQADAPQSSSARPQTAPFPGGQHPRPGPPYPHS